MNYQQAAICNLGLLGVGKQRWGRWPATWPDGGALLGSNHQGASLTTQVGSMGVEPLTYKVIQLAHPPLFAI